MKNMDDYHDYLKEDELLSVDVFEKFIDTCLKYYGLGPCHSFSSPGLSWDAMLKTTGVKLEKISDIDKHFLLKMDQEEKFLTLLKDMQKLITST